MNGFVATSVRQARGHTRVRPGVIRINERIRSLLSRIGRIQSRIDWQAGCGIDDRIIHRIRRIARIGRIIRGGNSRRIGSILIIVCSSRTVAVYQGHDSTCYHKAPCQIPEEHRFHCDSFFQHRYKDTLEKSKKSTPEIFSHGQKIQAPLTICQ